jgi:RimJ/RimL family protein N-acetyltransferase
MSTNKQDIEPIPFLKGENIDLVIPRSEWTELRCKWLNNPKVRTFLRGPLPRSIDQIKKRFESRIPDGLTDWVGFTLYHKKDKKPIGEIGLSRINWINGWANAFANIGEIEYWSKNIATEATHLLLKYAFEELNLNKVSGSVVVENIGSWTVAEKLGFKYEGTLKEEKYIDGKYCDEKRYGYLKSDWMKRKAEKSSKGEKNE